MTNKAVLIILDGYGIAPATPGNAITTANKPNLDRLFAEYPHSQLIASGLDVGLPEGQMGNSEVGHTNIGAGRVVFQILPKMTKEIDDGDFFKNPAYVKCLDDAVANDRPLHVMGLMSTGGVHSHLKHVFGMLDSGAPLPERQIHGWRLCAGCRPRICHRTWVSTTARAAVSGCCETEDEISNCVPFLSGAADSPPRQGIVPCA